MAAAIIIEPQTAAVTDKKVLPFKNINSALQVTNLDGSEEIEIFWAIDDTGDWQELFYNGVQQKLTATNNTAVVDGSMRLAVTKPVTANEVGVYQSTSGNR